MCSLVDIRHDASPLDVNMLAFLQELGLPYAVVFTKADKLSATKAEQQRALLLEQLNVPEEVPTVLTSSAKGTGVDALRKVISAACDGK